MKLPLNINIIILIPKFKGADKMANFIPIALANFMFKIITKILAEVGRDCIKNHVAKPEVVHPRSAY